MHHIQHAKSLAVRKSIILLDLLISLPRERQRWSAGSALPDRTAAERGERLADTGRPGEAERLNCPTVCDHAHIRSGNCCAVHLGGLLLRRVEELKEETKGWN